MKTKLVSVYFAAKATALKKQMSKFNLSTDNSYHGLYQSQNVKMVLMHPKFKYP